MEDRVEIRSGVAAGETDRVIGERIGRDHTIVWRERRRNTKAGKGYRAVAAESAARARRRRPQIRKVDADPVLWARVVKDLSRSRTPRQIAGRLRLEAADPTVEVMNNSLPAQGRVASHEAIYTWIYALPKAELAKSAIMLRSKRNRRMKRKALRSRTGGRIVGMVSIDDRGADVTDRRVPGHWEGDLIIGEAGKSAAATLVERTSRFTVVLALPEAKNADGLADVLIDHVSGMPGLVRRSLTWDQGTEMARHAALTLATELPVFFAHPHSPWQRPTNENTNGLIREYLPKGTAITTHQPYLTAIAEELNERPRAVLGYRTPREVYMKLLTEPVAYTG